MTTLKELENKVKLTVTKAKIKETFEQLTRFSTYKNFFKIKGQKFTKEDPYGEENWENDIKEFPSSDEEEDWEN
jgi:hypothetical protein